MGDVFWEVLKIARTILLAWLVRSVVTALLFNPSNKKKTKEELEEERNSKVVEVRDMDAFEIELEKAKAEGKCVVVDFSASWCPPCKRVKPHFIRMSIEFERKCRFLYVDVDKARDVAKDGGIQCMPTFQFYDEEGKMKEEEEVRGMDVAKIRKTLTETLGCKAKDEEKNPKDEITQPQPRKRDVEGEESKNDDFGAAEK